MDEPKDTIKRDKVIYGKITKLPQGYEIDGRYTVKEKLGVGGFGTVYKVWDKDTETYKALKLIHTEFYDDKQVLSELRHEAKLLMSVLSSNVVRLWDIHLSGDIKYLDMEYIDGGDLVDLKLSYPNRKVSEEKVIEIAKGIIDGMTDIHAKNIIHKDLKPQNVMLTKDGAVKIMDFGIAETFRSSHSRIEESRIAGTPAYMSPEQLIGKEVGKESDVWAFGVMLYELLTGRTCFGGSTTSEVHHSIKERLDVDRDKESREYIQYGTLDFPDNVSQKTREIINKCLKYNYRDRFGDFIEIRDIILDEVSEGEKLFKGKKINRKKFQRFREEKENSKDNIEIDSENKFEKTGDKTGGSISRFVWIGVVIIILGFLLYLGLGLFPGTVQIPDVVGMQYEDAKEVLTDNGLRVEKGELIKTKTKKNNKIKKQYPGSGPEVKKNTKIVLDVYQRNVDVPDVVNLAKSKARRELIRNDLVVEGIINKFHPTVDKGKIIGIENNARDLPENSAVNLVLSKGIEMETLPKLAGKSLIFGKRKLNNLGFELGKIIKVGNKKYDDSNVIVSTSPKPGRIAKGKNINLYVSKGNAYLPDLKGLSLKKAKNKLKNLGLKAGREKRIKSDIDKSNRIVRTYPSNGKLTKGTKVNLYVSLGNVMVPDLIGLTENEARQKLSSVGLKLGKVWEKITHEKKNHRKIIHQNNKTKKFPKGSYIDFNIGKYYTDSMVFVKGGKFKMGYDSIVKTENPFHNVTVDDFCISKYEITHAEYIQFLIDVGVSINGRYNGKLYIDMEDPDCAIGYRNSRFYFKGSSYATSKDCPVIEVTWYGANAYCKWKGGRLPTEAEWEYAARGGVESDNENYRYAGSNDIDKLAWYDDNSEEKTHPVGQKEPNELGIYDINGNVYEWCGDWYSKNYYSNSHTKNPKGPAKGSSRISRGGSFLSTKKKCSINYRYFNNPHRSYQNQGFRLVKDF